MIEIIDFTTNHIEQATQIAADNYRAECEHATDLPDAVFPCLAQFTENGLGVAAVKNGEFIGFLCCYPPFSNAFGLEVDGVFSPMHANGAVFNERAKIYSAMYQVAGEKWAKAGAGSHAICLYAHDKITQEQFFKYGFGLRSIDAIREMEIITAKDTDGFIYSELPPDGFIDVLSLNMMLDEHFSRSPIFMKFPYETEESFNEKNQRDNIRYFAAKKGGKAVAFVRIRGYGETVISTAPDMKNICGAYCMPEYRGMGVYQNLLNHMIIKLKEEGYRRLGVDFESFNPTAYGFWTKYFMPYTNSVVRHIGKVSNLTQ